MTDDTVVIGSYGTSFEARIALAHLESVGIDAWLATDNAGGAIPSLTGLSGGARVLVRAGDVERAREALADLDEPSDEDL